MSISPKVSYLEREFFDGRKPPGRTVRKNLCHVAVVDYCSMISMGFLNRAFSTSESAIQDVLGHNDRMQVGPCGGNCFHCVSMCTSLSVVSEFKICLKGRLSISCCCY